MVIGANRAAWVQTLQARAPLRIAAIAFGSALCRIALPNTNELENFWGGKEGQKQLKAKNKGNSKGSCFIWKNRFLFSRLAFNSPLWPPQDMFAAK
jgi:hypothetical protein